MLTQQHKDKIQEIINQPFYAFEKITMDSDYLVTVHYKDEGTQDYTGLREHVNIMSYTHVPDSHFLDDITNDLIIDFHETLKNYSFFYQFKDLFQIHNPDWIMSDDDDIFVKKIVDNDSYSFVLRTQVQCHDNFDRIRFHCDFDFEIKNVPDDESMPDDLSRILQRAIGSFNSDLEQYFDYPNDCLPSSYSEIEEQILNFSKKILTVFHFLQNLSLKV